jgi:hypothetical protein
MTKTYGRDRLLWPELILLGSAILGSSESLQHQETITIDGIERWINKVQYESLTPPKNGVKWTLKTFLPSARRSFLSKGYQTIRLIDFNGVIKIYPYQSLKDYKSESAKKTLTHWMGKLNKTILKTSSAAANGSVMEDADEDDDEDEDDDGDDTDDGDNRKDSDVLKEFVKTKMGTVNTQIQGPSASSSLRTPPTGQNETQTSLSNQPKTTGSKKAQEHENSSTTTRKKRRTRDEVEKDIAAEREKLLSKSNVTVESCGKKMKSTTEYV